jgi:hypothetical protein
MHCEKVASVLNYYSDKNWCAMDNSHSCLDSQSFSKLLSLSHLKLNKSFSHMPTLHVLLGR